MVTSFDYSWFLVKNISKFVSLPWKLNNRCCHIDHISFRYQRPEGKYLLARWYWGLHVSSIKKQVSVFDDDTLFGLPKARPTYCQCAKLFKNGTFWQHTTTGTRLGISNLGGLNTPIYEHSNSNSFELKKWFKPFESGKYGSQGRNQDLNLAKQKYEILTGHKNRY